MLILVILAYVVIVFIDQVSLFKQGLKKDFLVSSIMCVISFTIAVLLVLRIDIPSPAKPLENLIKIFVKKG